MNNFARSSNSSQTSRVRIAFAVLLLIGFFEFMATAGFFLTPTQTPENVFLFGLSITRLVTLGFTILPALFLLFTAIQKFLGKNWFRFSLIAETLPSPIKLWGIIILGLGSLTLWLMPTTNLGYLAGYLLRLKPLFLVLGVFSLQLITFWSLSSKKYTWDFSTQIPFLLFFIGFLGLAVFIQITRLGITPENSRWNIAGTPLTSFQFVATIFLSVAVLGLITIATKHSKIKVSTLIDVLLCLTLYLWASTAWSTTELPGNYFVANPKSSFGNIFPASDAAVHDVGALSILNGWGISFGDYTDKPLYMIFLSILHLLSPTDYTSLTRIHASILAISIPILYLFGKSIQSRLAGLLVAIFIILRQQNAISLAGIFIFGANPRVFLTEVPTMLGLIIATWLLFYWMSPKGAHTWVAMALGSLIGALSLIRLNPLLLFLAIPPYILLVFKDKMVVWIRHTAIFVLGFSILVGPWLVTGVNANGQPYLIYKFFDIIDARYNPTSILNQPEQHISTTLKRAKFAYHQTPPTNKVIEIQEFPGFVINHFLHNLVSSFLTLPDSISYPEQNLEILSQRSYWKDGRVQIANSQIPFALGNLAILSIGIAWSWKKWRWRGFAPAWIFIVYSLSLALARTSGARYLVANDWIVYLYYGVGIAIILQMISEELSKFIHAQTDDTDIKDTLPKSPQWKLPAVFALSLLLASAIPIASYSIPERVNFCDPVNITNSSLQNSLTYYKGEVLYPIKDKGTLIFTLLTCKGPIEVQAIGYNGRLTHGQTVIAGWDSTHTPPGVLVRAIFTDNPDPVLLWDDIP